MKIRLFLALAIAFAPLSLAAQEAEEESPWSGKAALGYLAITGNTESSTLKTGFEVGYATGDWEHLFAAQAIRASENKVSTAEVYTVGWKTDRNFTDQDFLFGRLDWRNDEFGAFNTQFSQTIGYGRRLIDNDKHSLNVELGLGARQSELQTGEDDDETIYTAGGFYRWQFSESASFRQEIRVEAGKSNTYAESATFITARLVGDLALVASYTIKNNSDVPPLTEKTDTYAALSLEYSF